MTEFQKKEIIGSETLGEKLKNAREEQGYTLEQVADQTRIKPSNINYLETGQYNKLPGLLFIENYLKTYTNFLQLSWPRVKKMYDQERIMYKEPEKPGKSARHIKRALNVPKLVYGLLIAMVVLIIFSYLGFEISNIVEPPTLEVYNVPDNMITEDNSVNIVGQTDPEANVFINGQMISVDPSGNFQEVVSLQEGINTMTISAKKKHSKELVIVKQIKVKKKTQK
ncbi:helix-turn-helix domain-containing protein [Patescibacteria group bacterium]|nr:helix-turn-helix domain-containing protein [Patescibacteria group bacterium]MBU1674017.1 helix-turn-helix domain-containing protein [Patescibacteria group bacterium]MBU1963171.1 helix-turn-helix domain-containing protein [Patescibacteria group bacterium]